MAQIDNIREILPISFSKFCRSLCSHILTTRHPSPRNFLVTSRSLFLLRSIFGNQYFLRLRGILQCQGQPCQKQESINMATFLFREKMSGLPVIFPYVRKRIFLFLSSSQTIVSSFVSFERTRLITTERAFLVRVSIPSG